MSAREVTDYLAPLEDAKRTALEALRQTILEILPAAEQGLSYGIPAFKVGSKTVAGFAAFKNHPSYFPHSGSVISKVGAEAAPFSTTKGTLHFKPDTPLPRALVEKLIAVRLRELGLALDDSTER